MGRSKTGSTGFGELAPHAFWEMKVVGVIGPIALAARVSIGGDRGVRVIVPEDHTS